MLRGISSMSEVILAVSAIASFSIAIGTLLYVKRSMSTENILNKIDELSDEIMTNKELQGKLYTVGAILGNGIRQGIGINAKGGKFKLDNIIGEVVSGLAQKYLGMGQQEQPQQKQEGDIFGQTS
jgi:hypothetical protein